MEMIRKALIEVLEEVNTKKTIKLPYSKEELKGIIFDKKIDDNKKEYYVIAKELNKVIHKINFTNISFDDVNVEKVDFSKMHCVKINPQKVYKKSLEYANVTGVKFITDDDKNSQTDLFENVRIRGTKFDRNKKIKLNPQTVFRKDLTESKLKGINFTGCSFDDVTLVNTDFTGSTGVIINPQTIKDKRLTGAKLYGVNLKGNSFDNAKINHADFTGSIGARINPNTINNVWYKSSISKFVDSDSTGLNCTNCTDAILTCLPNPDVVIERAIFNEENLKKIYEEQEKELEKNKEKIKELIFK